MPQSTDREPRRIYVVEDERMAFAEMRHHLERMGYRIAGWARSGEAAVDEVSALSPDLVLMDIVLDGAMDGVEAAERIRRETDLPVILVTAHSGESLSERITAAAPYGVVMKPFEPDVARTAIELALQASDLQKRLRREVAINTALAALSRTLIATKDMRRIAQAVLDEAQRLTGSPLGLVGYLDQRTGELVCPAVGAPAKIGAGGGVPRLPLPERGLWHDVLVGLTPVMSNDVPSDPRSAGPPSDHPPISRFLAVPATTGGRLTGVVAVGNAARAYGPGDQAFLERVADIFALAVQRMRTEASLSESEVRFGQLMEQASDGIMLLDEDEAMAEVNARACEMTGYAREELLGMRFADLLAAGARPEEQAADSERLHRGESVLSERVFRRADGVLVEVELSAKRVGEAGGDLYQVFLRDIGARKTAQRQIESLARFPRENPNPVLRVTRSGRLAYANPASMPLLAAWNAEPGGAAPPEIIEMARAGFGGSAPLELERETAGRFYVFTVTPIPDEDYVNIYAQDVTVRRAAEAEIRRLATAVEQAGEGFVLTDRHFRVTYANPAFERMCGFSRGEILGRDVSAMTEGSDMERRESSVAIARAVDRSGLWSGRLRQVARDGRRLTVEATIAGVRGTDGRPSDYVTIWRDVTREERLEQELRQAQKMEAVGTLAGGIAHDFNNILAAVVGFSEMAAIKADEPEFVRRNLRLVLESCTRARDLVRHILTFCRRAEQHRMSVSLSAVVRDSLKMLRATLPADIAIEAELDPVGGDLILADPIQIHQVIMNIGVNAGYAMREDGGRLRIVLRREETRGEAGACMALELEDTGPGMTEGVLGRIFDPFFSTKPQGEGTGMGLSISHGIIRSHGGTISAFSTPGKGTRFELRLPAVSGTGAARSGEEELPAGGQGRVLVVDDEPGVLQAVVQMLGELGYEVTATTDPREALDMLARAPRDFDCLLTDHAMPGLTGLNLSREALGIRPGLPIVICTGYSDILDKDRAEAAGIGGFLMKPLFVRDLDRTLSRVLSGKDG